MDWSQLGQWHSFTLRLEGGQGNENVRIRVNAAGDDRSLGMQNWRPSWRPSQGSCLPRQNAVVYKRRNETFYVAACSGGASSITVEVFGGSHTDGRGNPVWGPLVRYEVKAVDGFDIELVFIDNGVYNTQEREWLRDAADRWERIITEGLPDETYFVNNPEETLLGEGEIVTVKDRIRCPPSDHIPHQICQPHELLRAQLTHPDPPDVDDDVPSCGRPPATGGFLVRER